MEVRSARQHCLPLPPTCRSLCRRVALLAGVLFLLLTGTSLPVQAQSPEYQPIGVRWGSVLVFPVIKVREAYNDNIFREDVDVTDSFVTQVLPSFVAVTDWEEGEILLQSAAQLGFYESSPADDYFDAFASIDASYNVSPSTWFYAEDVGFWHLHEARGSDEVPLSAAEPTIYDKWGATVGGVYKPSVFGVNLSASYYDYIYDETAAIGGAAPIDGGPRDYQNYSGSLKVGYDIQPGYEAFVRGIYSVENYDEAINAGGFNRDSDEYTVLLGMAYNPSPLIEATVDAGYFYREYDDPTLGTISGPAFNLEAVWSVTPLMTIGLLGHTKVEETTDAASAGKLVYGSQVAVAHELLPNLVLDGNLAYDYISYDGGTSDRVDNDIIAGLGGTYWMAQHMFVGANYELRYRSSSLSGFDYTQNVYMITVGAQW